MTLEEAALRESGLALGPDGKLRCAWSSSAPEYRAYHDDEWGKVVHGDRAIFERLTLEAFQSGLSWLTILRKREGFRRAFAEWDVEAIAAFGDADTARLLSDTSIVRNRAKIAATINNARVLASMWATDGAGALDALVWSHAPHTWPRPTSLAAIRPSTEDSVALSKSLKRKGFTFVGPTTMYAAMQAMGLVDDHLAGCHAIRG